MKIEVNPNLVEKIKEREFATLIKTEFHGDRKGKLLIPGTDIDLMLIGADYFMADFMQTLRSYLKKAAYDILYTTGIEIGKLYFKTIGKTETKEEALESFSPCSRCMAILTLAFWRIR
ncbi:MAG: hypothetical protein QMD14_01305 [Candidatus Aenigmarchaeota archaeon]|nr:hypothetical protein [Candidatus Aenigmarchaeota archaeon]